MLEKTVEKYFVEQVEAHGGMQRKLAYVNRRNANDRLVIFPGGKISFVELKKPGKAARIGQQREHDRLRAMSCDVWVIDTLTGVDEFIARRAK